MSLPKIIVFLIILKSMVYGRVNHNGDFQYWHYLSVEQALKEGISSHLMSRLIGVMRWGDDASLFYFGYGQWQLVFAKKGLEIAPGYRQEYFRADREVPWVTRYNPMIDLTVSFPGPCRWQVEDRNRFLYHIPEHLPSALIYRNRLRCTSPAITPLFKLKFFMDDEIFYQDNLGFVQNRLSIGFVGDPTSWMKGRIYYMYRNLKQGPRWTFQNVLAFHIYF